MDESRQQSIDILKAAKEVIADPAHWTTGSLGRKADGSACVSTDPQATSWCALGAIGKVAPISEIGPPSAPVSQAVGVLHRLLGPKPCLADFNDEHTHAEVLALFDRAIAQLNAGM